MSNRMLPVGFAVLVPFSALLSVLGGWCFYQTGLAVKSSLRSNQHRNQQKNRKNSAHGRSESMSASHSFHRINSQHSHAEWVLFLTVFCSASFLSSLVLWCIYSLIVVIRVYDTDEPSNKKVKKIEGHSDLSALWALRILCQNAGYITLLVISFERLVNILSHTKYALKDWKIRGVRYSIITAIILIVSYAIVDGLVSLRYAFLIVAPLSLWYPMLSIGIIYRFWDVSRRIAMGIVSNESQSSIPSTKPTLGLNFSSSSSARASSDDEMLPPSLAAKSSDLVPSMSVSIKRSKTSSVSRKISQKNNRLIQASLRLTIVTFTSTISTFCYVLFWYGTFSFRDEAAFQLVNLLLFGLDSCMNLFTLVFFFAKHQKYYLFVFGTVHQYLFDKLQNPNTLGNNNSNSSMDRNDISSGNQSSGTIS